MKNRIVSVYACLFLCCDTFLHVFASLPSSLGSHVAFFLSLSLVSFIFMYLHFFLRFSSELGTSSHPRPVLFLQIQKVRNRIIQLNFMPLMLTLVFRCDLSHQLAIVPACNGVSTKPVLYASGTERGKRLRSFNLRRSIQQSQQGVVDLREGQERNHL